MGFPMPGDKIKGGAAEYNPIIRTVVASAWHIDTDDETEVAVLTMRHDAPFYAVEYWYAHSDGTLHKWYAETLHQNICNAAAQWSEICGVDCEIA